jgi:hypothetical protein
MPRGSFSWGLDAPLGAAARQLNCLAAAAKWTPHRGSVMGERRRSLFQRPTMTSKPAVAPADTRQPWSFRRAQAIASWHRRCLAASPGNLGRGRGFLCFRCERTPQAAALWLLRRLHFAVAMPGEDVPRSFAFDRGANGESQKLGPRCHSVGRAVSFDFHAAAKTRAEMDFCGWFAHKSRAPSVRCIAIFFCRSECERRRRYHVRPLPPGVRPVHRQETGPRTPAL